MTLASSWTPETILTGLWCLFCSAFLAPFVSKDSGGDGEAQDRDDYRENYLRSDVPHVEVFHHEVQQECVADEKGNGHGDIQRELTANHVSSFVLDIPEFLKREVQSCVQNEPNHRRNDIPDAEVLREAVQRSVIGNDAGDSYNAEPHDLPEARRFGSH